DQPIAGGQVDVGGVEQFPELGVGQRQRHRVHVAQVYPAGVTVLGVQQRLGGGLGGEIVDEDTAAAESARVSLSHPVANVGHSATIAATDPGHSATAYAAAYESCGDTRTRRARGPGLGRGT